MDDAQAGRDLELVRDLVARTQRRIDTHAYQFIWWGSIVLVWYPLGNSMPERFGLISVIALAVGAVGSTFLGWRNNRRPRIAAESTRVSRQLGAIVAVCIGGGIVLSVALPTARALDPRLMPTMWALIYGVMTTMTGIVSTKEWCWSGAGIFAAAIVSLYLPDYSGYITGVAMGLGLIVPGILCERRVARLRAEDEAALDA